MTEINFLKYFTFRRIMNLLGIYAGYCASVIYRRPLIWGNAVTLSTEPTNMCNLRCPECPSGSGGLTRPMGMMNMDLFREIIDQVKKNAFYIQLYFQGEPLLNKHLPEMIEYCAGNNLYVSLSTNALLLNQNLIARLLSNPPDKIIFSIDGLDQETYSQYRIGGSFRKAETGLKLLLEEKKRRNLKKPFTELQFIVMKQNEHQIPEVIEYGHRLGINKITLKTMQVNSLESAYHFLPLNPKYSRYIVSGTDFKVKSKIKNKCFALWRTAVITWDGKMVTCCFDKDASNVMGDVTRNAIIDIWKGEKYFKFREAVLTNRAGIPICRNCTEGMNMNILEI